MVTSNLRDKNRYPHPGLAKSNNHSPTTPILPEPFSKSILRYASSQPREIGLLPANLVADFFLQLPLYFLKNTWKTFNQF
jgi:hypothetical protein